MVNKVIEQSKRFQTEKKKILIADDNKLMRDDSLVKKTSKPSKADVLLTYY